MMQLWEYDAIPYNQIKKKYDYAIVLSGIANPIQEPQDRIHFNKGADRIFHAIELYKKGIVEKLLITGGSGSILYPDAREGNKLRQVAITAGVPTDDIILEDQSRNTAENAKYTSELTDGNSNCLLITSAFHMRRARGCFQKAGMMVDTFPTDLYSSPITFAPGDWLIPHSAAFSTWNVLIKEWIGYITYWLVGYI